jgi:hypothetical protein
MLEVTGWRGALPPLERAAAGALVGRSLPVTGRRWNEVISRLVWPRMASGSTWTRHMSRLVQEHGYDGSLRSLQRYVGKQFPKPKCGRDDAWRRRRARQAQADWAEFRGVLIMGELVDLYAFPHGA